LLLEIIWPVKLKVIKRFAMNAIGFFGLPMITAGIIKPDSPKLGK
jgi:hypothetical protein